MVFIRNLLIPFAGREDEVPALRIAIQLAKQFGAKLECLFLMPTPNQYIYSGSVDAPLAVTTEFNKLVQEQAVVQRDKAHQLLQKVAEEEGVSVHTTRKVTDEPSIHYRVESGDSSKLLAQCGRMADLLLINQGTINNNPYIHTATLAALFETGRPVFLIPTGYLALPEKKTVAIAWDDSQHAVRALTAAKPFLLEADKIKVMVVEETDKSILDLENLLYYLGLYHLDAEIVQIEKHTFSVAKTLAKSLEKHEVDLLVMGAFSHNRFRHIVIGGVTDYMLDKGKVPVLMMH